VTPEVWKRAKEVFSAALGLPEGDREAFLAAQQDAREIVNEVRSLLAAYDESPDFLENAASHPPAHLAARESASPYAGRRIGAWELVREIGQGGMGVVWEARRADQQYAQRAAVKLLRASLFSEQDARRFREERQILASLNHPSIARLLDGGMLEDGEPYLVMEYIDGLPLNSWCELHKPNLRQRIQLCLEICAAVEYAHRQLVIHRDLKPANILVDAGGTPKLLDFGIAKLVAEGGSYRVTTNLLTPECASPEQARGERMSTASDQFSLGVLLYQLLTGRHPFARPDASPIEALRAICEDEPRLPSSVAGNGGRELRGELDAILLQTLNKNPAARYPSVTAFAADLRAWLEGLPVSAIRQSWWRRSTKVILRYKALSAAIATAVLMLVTGIVVTSIEARRALHAEREALVQRDRAESAQQAAQLQRDRAVAAEKSAIVAEKAAAEDRNRAVSQSLRADNEAESAKAINAFLQNDLLAQASPDAQATPETKPDPDLKVRTALDRAAKRIQGRFANQPLVEASIRHTIGGSYFDLKLFTEAEGQIEREVEIRRKVQGETSPDTLLALEDLAEIYTEESKYPRAEELLRQVLRACNQTIGENAPRTLDTMVDIGSLSQFTGRFEEGESLLRRALAARERLYPGDSQKLVYAAAYLAKIYYLEKNYSAAESVAAKYVELSRRTSGGDSPDTQNLLQVLARICMSTKRYAEAEKILNEQIETQTRLYGSEKIATLSRIDDLAAVYIEEGRDREAAEVLSHLVETSTRVNGKENFYTLSYERRLATALEAMGRFDEAEKVAAGSYEAFGRVYGETNIGTITVERILAWIYIAQGKQREARPLLDSVLDLWRKNQGAGPYDEAFATTLLGISLVDDGEIDSPETEKMLSEALAMDRKVQADGFLTRACLTGLARLRLAQQRYSEAEVLLREAIGGAGGHDLQMWDISYRQSLLGASLLGQGKYAEAEPLLISGYEGLQKLSPAISAEANLPDAGLRIVRLYTAWGKPEKAVAWRQRLDHHEK
jgi:tRNA A-37 threonylcarbamoyl transferase component Bud32